MIIKADQEGTAVIQQLCDVALKVDGLKAMQGIANILQKIEKIEGEEMIPLSAVNEQLEMEKTG